MCSPCLPHIILTTTEVDVFIPILQRRDLSLKNIELVSRGAKVRTLIDRVHIPAPSGWELEQKSHFPESVHSPLKWGSYFLPHFADGETEAERRDLAQILQLSSGAGI